MELSDWHPISTLQVRKTVVERPKFGVIDAHQHLGEFGKHWEDREPAELIDVLDAACVRVFVDLDGGWGEDILDAHLAKFKSADPERFAMFGGVEWRHWPEHGNSFGEWAAKRFEAQVARGAQGLKIWKPLGLHVRDQDGTLVLPDDERLDPVWQTAGELGVPVLIHTADPVGFFEPLDGTNEFWEILQRKPEWWFGDRSRYPAFETLLESMAALIERHAGTTFIGAHCGCYGENLAWVGALMDRCPNFYADFGARLYELGRQPHTARKWFLQYSDRIVFGTDEGAGADMYRRYYRYLETDDDWIGTGLGRFGIHGVALPDDVLRKVYYDNAARLLNLSRPSD
jgi:predicted TIM-barrel fold metal-dependent hydrolase